MFGQLLPCGGGDGIPLAKTRAVIGRGNDCDITLRHKNVSSRHCELELLDGYWHVRDLGSTNGVRVNGRMCESKYLAPKDVLSIATHRYAIDYRVQSDRPPPEPDRPMHLMNTSLMERAGMGDEMEKTAEYGPGEETKDHRDEEDWAGASEIPQVMLGELVPCGGGEPIPLLKPKLTIGRSGRCDIVLRYSTVSGRHCEMEFLNGFWRIHDLGSRNGTFVDDVRCESKWLMPDNVLSIAKQRFHIVYTPLGDEPPPDDDVSLTRSLMEKAGLGRRKRGA